MLSSPTLTKQLHQADLIAIQVAHVMQYRLTALLPSDTRVINPNFVCCSPSVPLL